jgi:probable addiction module antidote protein
MKKVNNDFKTDLIEKLKDPVRARNYLREALALSLEDGDGATFQLALKDVAEAQGGVAIVSKKAGIQRENIYRVLSKERHPKFDSILKISKAVGFHG